MTNHSHDSEEGHAHDDPSDDAEASDDAKQPTSNVSVGNFHKARPFAPAFRDFCKQFLPQSSPMLLSYLIQAFCDPSHHWKELFELKGLDKRFCQEFEQLLAADKVIDKHVSSQIKSLCQNKLQLTAKSDCFSPTLLELLREVKLFLDRSPYIEDELARWIQMLYHQFPDLQCDDDELSAVVAVVADASQGRVLELANVVKLFDDSKINAQLQEQRLKQLFLVAEKEMLVSRGDEFTKGSEIIIKDEKKSKELEAIQQDKAFQKRKEAFGKYKAKQDQVDEFRQYRNNSDHKKSLTDPLGRKDYFDMSDFFEENADCEEWYEFFDDLESKTGELPGKITSFVQLIAPTAPAPASAAAASAAATAAGSQNEEKDENKPSILHRVLMEFHLAQVRLLRAFEELQVHPQASSKDREAKAKALADCKWEECLKVTNDCKAELIQIFTFMRDWVPEVQAIADFTYPFPQKGDSYPGVLMRYPSSVIMKESEAPTPEAHFKAGKSDFKKNFLKAVTQSAEAANKVKDDTDWINSTRRLWTELPTGASDAGWMGKIKDTQVNIPLTRRNFKSDPLCWLWQDQSTVRRNRVSNRDSVRDTTTGKAPAGVIEYPKIQYFDFGVYSIPNFRYFDSLGARMRGLKREDFEHLESNPEALAREVKKVISNYEAANVSDLNAVISFLHQMDWDSVNFFSLKAIDVKARSPLRVLDTLSFGDSQSSKVLVDDAEPLLAVDDFPVLIDILNREPHLLESADIERRLLFDSLNGRDLPVAVMATVGLGELPLSDVAQEWHSMLEIPIKTMRTPSFLLATLGMANRNINALMGLSQLSQETMRVNQGLMRSLYGLLHGENRGVSDIAAAVATNPMHFEAIVGISTMTHANWLKSPAVKDLTSTLGVPLAVAEVISAFAKHLSPGVYEFFLKAPAVHLKHQAAFFALIAATGEPTFDNTERFLRMVLKQRPVDPGKKAKIDMKTEQIVLLMAAATLHEQSVEDNLKRLNPRMSRLILRRIKCVLRITRLAKRGLTSFASSDYTVQDLIRETAVLFNVSEGIVSFIFSLGLGKFSSWVDAEIALHRRFFPKLPPVLAEKSDDGIGVKREEVQDPEGRFKDFTDACNIFRQQQLCHKNSYSQLKSYDFLEKNVVCKYFIRGHLTDDQTARQDVINKCKFLFALFASSDEGNRALCEIINADWVKNGTTASTELPLERYKEIKIARRLLAIARADMGLYEYGDIRADVDSTLLPSCSHDNSHLENELECWIGLAHGAKDVFSETGAGFRHVLPGTKDLMRPFRLCQALAHESASEFMKEADSFQLLINAASPDFSNSVIYLAEAFLGHPDGVKALCSSVGARCDLVPMLPVLGKLILKDDISISHFANHLCDFQPIEDNAGKKDIKCSFSIDNIPVCKVLFNVCETVSRSILGRHPLVKILQQGVEVSQ